MAVTYSQNGVIVKTNETPYNVIGGRKYKTVIMPDGKEWLAENLDLSVSMNGALYYNNDEATYGWEGKRYGQLYTLGLITQLVKVITGWRLPAASDFEALVASIGADAATKLKSMADWTNSTGTDNYGFTAYPAGNNTSATFYSIGTATTFWTSEPISQGVGVAYYMDGGSSLVRDTPSEHCAYSIRLVRDAI